MVQMGYMYRYNPAFVLLRQFLRDGWLGEIFEVHTVMSKVVSDADRRNLAQYPGGIMFELGCHVIDQVVQVLGTPDRVQSYARHSAVELNDALVDNMLAVCEYPRALATVKSSAQEFDGGARRHFVACAAAMERFTSNRSTDRRSTSRSIATGVSTKKERTKSTSARSHAMWETPPIWPR